jgi:hypothetical protein
LVVGVCSAGTAQGINDAGLVSVFCSISEQFQRFPFLVGFGLVVRLDRFPDRFSRTEHHRCWLGGRRSAQSIRSARASSALKVSVWFGFARFPVNPESGRLGLGG